LEVFSRRLRRAKPQSIFSSGRNREKSCVVDAHCVRSRRHRSGVATQGPSRGYSKANLQQTCQFSRTISRKMAPRTRKRLQERGRDTPTKGLLWIGFLEAGGDASVRPAQQWRGVGLPRERWTTSTERGGSDLNGFPRTPVESLYVEREPLHRTATEREGSHLRMPARDFGCLPGANGA